MNLSKIEIAGLVTIALTGLLHLVEMPEYFGEQRYVGVLFGLSVAGAVAAMIGIMRREAWGWSLGTLVAIGCIAGYLLSRTVGLPSFRENSWSAFLEPMGLLSLAVEFAFLIVVSLRMRPETPTYRTEQRAA